MIFPVLAVKDVSASVEFYTKKLGFDLDAILPGANDEPLMGFVRHGENALGLSLETFEEERGLGVALMLYFPEDGDLDAYYAQIQQNGVAILDEIKTEYWGDRVFGIKDPDGYMLNFAKTVQKMTMDEVVAQMPKSS